MNKKIKICFVIDTLIIGGANKLTFDTVKYLDDNKFEIGIVTLFSVNNDEHLMNTEFNEKAISYHFLNFNNHGFIKNIKSLKVILENYDIINSVLENSNFYCSFIRKFLIKNKTFIATFHGLDIESIDDTYFNKEIKRNWSLKYKFKINILQKYLFSSYDYFISVSRFISEFALNKYNINESKMFTIYHGIDISKFENKGDLDELIKIRDKYSILENDFVIGYVGRITYAKGLESLVSVFSEIALSNKKYKLILVGDGVRREYLERLINDKSIQNQCFLTGLVYDVSSYYRIFDLFVLPSFAEGLPLTLLEAMYFKNVVLSSDVGGVPEVIVNQENGFLFRKGDFNQMKLLVEQISRNNPNLKNIGDKASADVKDKFDLRKNIISIENLYLRSQI